MIAGLGQEGGAGTRCSAVLCTCQRLQVLVILPRPTSPCNLGLAIPDPPTAKCDGAGNLRNFPILHSACPGCSTVYASASLATLESSIRSLLQLSSRCLIKQPAPVAPSPGRRQSPHSADGSQPSFHIQAHLPPTLLPPCQDWPLERNLPMAPDKTVTPWPPIPSGCRAPAGISALGRSPAATASPHTGALSLLILRSRRTPLTSLQ